MRPAPGPRLHSAPRPPFCRPPFPSQTPLRGPSSSSAWPGLKTLSLGREASPPTRWPEKGRGGYGYGAAQQSVTAGVCLISRTDQNVGAGDGGELQVFDGSLLQLHVRVPDLAVAAQHLLDGGLGLWEQVDELDVGRQQQRTSGHGAQVELGVEQVELDQGAKRETRRDPAAPQSAESSSKMNSTPGPRVTSNQVSKLSQYVASNLHHVLMTGGGLQGLQRETV